MEIENKIPEKKIKSAVINLFNKESEPLNAKRLQEVEEYQREIFVYLRQ